MVTTDVSNVVEPLDVKLFSLLLVYFQTTRSTRSAQVFSV
jgi:hypothetical protein